MITSLTSSSKFVISYIMSEDTCVTPVDFINFIKQLSYFSLDFNVC